MRENRLAHEKSPYLLQHAHNPVDWHPWSQEAFQKAETEDKPVFLSIGYSTCHWCHVMAHESFEDETVARLLNDAFICIKVDREERPDIDKIYMAACQILTGSGGWPLSIFMAPDQRPFYAATYIPKESRYGRTGLIDLIPRIQHLWRTQRPDVLRAAEDLTRHLSRDESALGGTLSAGVLDHAYRTLQAGYDKTWGGFGPAPKFPIPLQLLFLLRYGRGTEEGAAVDMAVHTLSAMRRGGLYDHLGFGFHRYSTDATWLVPHFEKMLYDQALMAMACLEAYQTTGDEAFAATAEEIFAYVARDMTSPEGGWYSAEDADSEGEEGKYYTWTEAEIRAALPDMEADLAVRVFGVERNGNYRDEATQASTGQNILHLKDPPAMAASRFGLTGSDFREKTETVRRKLFAVRSNRISPSRDDKILTDWNGLMIAALARGAWVLEEASYLERALAAAAFIFKNMSDRNGRLLHRWRDGDAAVPALLDDYAFLIWGLLECYEATLDPAWLHRARALQEQVDARFRDAQHGGYYFTPDDGGQAITRQKETYDGAVPSGNAVTLLNLIRLNRLTGQGLWKDHADSLIQAFAGIVSRVPSGHTMFMVALAWMFHDPREIVIAGDPAAPDTQAMLQIVRRAGRPHTALLLRPPFKTSPDISDLAPFTRDMAMIDGRATAYVCSGQSCRPPTNDADSLADLLAGRR